MDRCQLRYGVKVKYQVILKERRMKDVIHLKINIGCGPTGQIDGFINLDNSPSVILARFPMLKTVLNKLGVISEQQYKADWRRVTRCDVSKRLPFGDESVDKIYSSHFLEHIPQEKGVRVLMECFRVMKRGAVMRLVVPDLLWHAERYVENTKSMLVIPHPQDRSAHDAFLHTVYGAYLSKKRYGAEHCYMYDFPTLNFILKEVGFHNIQQCDYQEGTDMELASCDLRPEDSLHSEIQKK